MLLKKILTSLLGSCILSYFVVNAAPDCNLIIPQFPLSYNGLITPYQLASVSPAAPCLMKDPQAATFVEALIFDIDTKSLMLYHPIVVTAGTNPLVPPTTFNMPPNSIVGIWFGTNANSITLMPQTNVIQGKCINGIPNGVGGGDIFGQFAHCNGEDFFNKINGYINTGIKLNPPIPPLGVAVDGDPCLTTRDFTLVDMDPSDNVVTTYLVDPATGLVAQDTPSNRVNHPTAIILKNGSDNRLLTVMDQAMGCTPYNVPSLTDPTGTTKITSLALNEIHAAMNQNPPYAYIPKGDPMTRVKINANTVPSIVKINAYRRGVNQPQITSLDQALTLHFCGHMVLTQLQRLQKNKALLSTQLSPDPAAANSLFTFMANRFFGSYLGLKCDVLLDLQNPVNLIVTNNIVTDAIFNIVDNINFDLPDPYLVGPNPTINPTQQPTINPTQAPTINPTQQPTASPTVQPGGGMIVLYVFGGVIGLGVIAAIIKICYNKFTTERNQNQIKNENETKQSLLLESKNKDNDQGLVPILKINTNFNGSNYSPRPNSSPSNSIRLQIQTPSKLVKINSPRKPYNYGK